MSPDDPRHGTYAGASAHRKIHEKPCDACLRAERNHHALALADRIAGRPRTVPAIGTIRRIRALRALGWSVLDIAETAGLPDKTIRNPCHRGTSVYRSTADAIARAYDQLSMSIPAGPYHERGRRYAARQGWAPPLAWDEGSIDDPAARPFGTGYQPPSRETVLRDLAERGDNLTAACRELGMTADTLQKWATRKGLGDLYRALAAREGSWNTPGRMGRSA